MPLPNHFDQNLAHLRQLQANLFATMQPILRKPRMLRTLHERLALALGHRALATCDIYAIAAKGEYYGAAMVQTRVQLDSCLCFFARELADWDEALEFGDIDLANRETPKGHWVSSVRYFQGCTLAFTRLLREWLDSHDLG